MADPRQRAAPSHVGNVGVVLAAGAGSRLGMPKALAAGSSGHTWAADTAAVMAAGGCDRVLVVVGADADAVADSLPPEATAITCPDWATGIAASLRAGLLAAQAVPGGQRVVVVPVDTPGLSAAAVRRVLDIAGPSQMALVRAVYRGVPGHPVVFGAQHLSGAIASVAGDQGARGYLLEHGATRVECSDVAAGEDVDTPEDWRAWKEGRGHE